MLKRLAIALWGKFESKEEVQKFLLLGAIFFCIIGTYWAMRPMKDSIFIKVVGSDYIPMAKWLSLAVVMLLLVVYSKLVDLLPRHKVFYILTGGYAVTAVVLAYILNSPAYGLDNTVTDPSRFIGWIWYCYVESFGSLIVALFWAFTTDITKEESAKRGFPLIALLGQTGNIVGPWYLNAKSLGFTHSGPMIYILAGLVIAMGILMWVFMHVTPKSQMVGYQEVTHGGHPKETTHSEPGFFEGLKLLITQPYLLSIFLLLFFYEVIVTFFDFLFKATAGAAFPLERDLGAYLANYGAMTGVVATACVLLGINKIQQYLGFRFSLVLTPILVAIAAIVVRVYPGLTVFFWVMVLAKAMNYALNQPTIKQLYIPTSKDARYKSQAWIEMFGSRGSKATASGVNALRLWFTRAYGAGGASLFLTVTTGVSLGLVGAWLFIIPFLARTYQKAVDKKQVVC